MFLQGLAKTVDGRLAVAVLTPLLSSHDSDARGQVRQTHRRLGAVLVLAARPPCREGLHPTLGKKTVVVRNIDGIFGIGGLHVWNSGDVLDTLRRVFLTATEPRMIYDRSDQNPGANVLFVLACLVVVVYGMRLAAPILLPAALALFLTVLSLPVMLWLRERRVPSWIATALTVLLNVGVIGLLVMIVSQSVSELQAQLPRYIRLFQELQASWFGFIESRTDIVVSEVLSVDLVDPAAFIDFARGAVGRVAQFVSMTFLVFLIMAFMLSEAMVFPAKFRYISPPEARNQERLQKVVTEVQTYLGIKTVVSLATGLILGAWAWVTGLDFPILLGLVAFLMNYVPTVGSILAALPALFLSLILVGTIGHALLVLLGYVVVNTVFGNILEPTLMGRRLGLSTLVVILSLLFWGWAWGPLGALLSVPLTVVVKIWLENTKDLRWVAILLDKTPPPMPTPDAPSEAG